MRIHFLLALAFVMMLTPSPAYAYYGGSIDIISDVHSVCPCDILSSDEMVLELTNYGTGSDTFFISMEIPEGWSGFIVPEATLASGESVYLDPAWITPPCGTEPGVYKIRFIAESAMSGKIADEEMELDIMRCHDVQLSGETSVGTCKGKEVTSSVTVKNLGKGKETFILSTDSEWASVYPEQVTVDPWAEASVEVRMKPADGFIGNKDITLTAVSSSTYADDDMTIILTANNCYQFSASVVPTEDVICMGDSGEYYIQIDNKGTKSDTYMIVTPAWARADKSSVTVAAGSRGNVRVTAIPPETGDLILSVFVSSDTQSTEAVTVESLVKSVDCRDGVVMIMPPEASICIGEGTEYSVMIENNGNVPTTYTLDATIGSSLSREKLILGPGEVQNVILTIGAAEKAGTFPVSVDAYVDGVPVDADASTLIVRTCYDAGLIVRPNNADACIGDTLSFDVIVKNNGEYDDTYEFLYPGGEADFDLEPGEINELDITIDVTEEWDDVTEIPFILTSSNGIRAEKVIAQNVTPPGTCYSVDVSLLDDEDSEITTVIGYGSPVGAKISNTGNRKSVFFLSVDGPEWAYVSDASVELYPGEEKEVYLYISPTYDVEEGSYTMSLLAESDSSFSATDIKAKVLSDFESPEEEAQELEGGLTGMFISNPLPLEITLISMMAFFTVLLVVLRFIIFR